MANGLTEGLQIANLQLPARLHRELDIVIPVYNEGENIVQVLDSLRRSVTTPFRVLICYDHD